MSFVAAWSLEWRTALARRRLFLLNVLVPLALVAPVAAADAPAVHQAAVYAVLFILFGTFGSAIPLLRDAERGFVRRLSLTPLAPAGLLLGRTAAATALDIVQLVPAALFAGALGTASSAAALIGALAFANIFGAWVAAAVRSIAEGALFCAVGSLLLLHAAGVFRTPSGPIGRFAEHVAPYRMLHEELLAVDPAGGAALAIGVVCATIASALFARPLVRALARADGRS